jgi:hypothetical protein
MSCLGSTYNPNPTREWYRFTPYQETFVPDIDVLTLLDPFSNISNNLKYLLPEYVKGNILQYKENSANLTQNQIYAQIARGLWTNRTKTWASQSESVTDPNSGILQRVNYETVTLPRYDTDGTEVFKEVAYSADSVAYCDPIKATNQNLSFSSLPMRSTLKRMESVLPLNAGVSSSISMPPYVSKPKNKTVKVVQNGGRLIGNVVQNPCNGEILARTFTEECSSSSSSDVPGRSTTLCWNSGLQTYYPKTKRTYGTSDNKWPQGEKAIFPA